jgi:hypothetical protein
LKRPDELDEVISSQVIDSAMTSGDDVGDAFQANSGFSSYINNADAKAGLGAAAAAAIVAGVSQQSAAMGSALTAHTSTERWARFVLVLLAIALLVAVVSIGVALVPRTPVGVNGGRFSFPTVAEDSWQFDPATRPQAAQEAWAQAQTLARIAKRKFAAIRVAIYALGAAFLLFCCWSAVASRI